MLTDKVIFGQYNNPKVATTVIGGTIYDRNNRILAMDVPKYDVYVDPSYSELDVLTQVLSLHLNMTPDEISNQLVQKEDSLILLKSEVSEETAQLLAEDITENSLEAYIYIKKSYSRTYPAQFHASQLISLVEDTYKETLFPQAEFNTKTTYGSDIVLTIDLDIQYLLDLAVQNIYQLQNPQYVVAQLVDLTSQEILAVSYYPFADLNEASNLKVQSTLVGSFDYQEVKVSNLKATQKVLEHNSKTELSQNLDNSVLYTANQSVLSLTKNIDGTTSTIALIGTDSPKYLLFIGSYGAKYYTNSTILDDAIETLIDGLNSQNKL